MALVPLYFELLNKRLVTSLFDTSDYTVPPFRQEDTPVFDINVVRQTTQIVLANQAAFEKVSMGGYSVYVSVGLANGTPLVSASSSTLSSDNFTFKDVALPVVGAGIDALSDGASVYFEVRITDTATGRFFGRRFLTSIEKAVALSGSLATPFSDRAVALSELQLGYVPYRLPAGRGLEFVSADGTKSGILYLDNDGSFRLPGPAL